MTGLATYAPRITDGIMTVVFVDLFPQAQAFKVLRLGQFLLSLAPTHLLRHLLLLTDSFESFCVSFASVWEYSVS